MWMYTYIYIYFIWDLNIGWCVLKYGWEFRATGKKRENQNQNSIWNWFVFPQILTSNSEFFTFFNRIRRKSKIPKVRIQHFCSIVAIFRVFGVFLDTCSPVKAEKSHEKGTFSPVFTDNLLILTEKIIYSLVFQQILTVNSEFLTFFQQNSEKK